MFQPNFSQDGTECGLQGPSCLQCGVRCWAAAGPAERGQGRWHVSVPTVAMWESELDEA